MDQLNKNILYEMEEIQKSFYNEQSKNMFFKKSQKTQIAKTINEKFDLSQLLANTIYILPNTNWIYIDYPTLKMFIHPEIYRQIVDYILLLYRKCIASHGNYSLYVNLNGFTISAAERNKDGIILFCTNCLNQKDFNYSELITKIHILHAPSIMTTLMNMFKPYFAKNISERIELYKKTESDELINQLHQINITTSIPTNI